MTHEVSPDGSVAFPSRENFIDQHIQHGFGIAVVVSVILLVTDAPPVDAVLTGLGPPAVKDGTIWHTVHGRLHSAGPAGFHRSDRGVEPHVDTGGHDRTRVHRIIFQKHHGNFVAKALACFQHPLDEGLAAHVIGVGFP